jgi:hypothetical protein
MVFRLSKYIISGMMLMFYGANFTLYESLLLPSDIRTIFSSDDESYGGEALSHVQLIFARLQELLKSVVI